MNYTTKQDLNTTQFWMVDEAYLRSGYKKGHLNASGYVYGILKVSRKDGWWFSLNISEFCLKYEIPRTSLYRALKKLQKDPEINLEWSTTQVKIRIPMRDNYVPNLDVPNLENGVPNSVNGVPNSVNGVPNSVIDVPNLVNETAESLIQQDVQESLISSTDNLCYTDSSNSSTYNAQADASPLPHPSGREEIEYLEFDQEENDNALRIAAEHKQEEEWYKAQEDGGEDFDVDFGEESDYIEEAPTEEQEDVAADIVFFGEYLLEQVDIENPLRYEFLDTQILMRGKLKEYTSSGILDYASIWVASFLDNDIVGTLSQEYVAKFDTISDLLRDRVGLLILCDCVLRWEAEGLHLKTISQPHSA